jgi:hypothetical protein
MYLYMHNRNNICIHNFNNVYLARKVKMSCKLERRVVFFFFKVCVTHPITYYHFLQALPL